ncbi:hypothetical protein [Microterricola pindariensis]|uniref:Uncharacterized protein n=1 Tax=Microterricola pindariensis TaxID=478010 RepID=A0ABX5AUJ5_9MICO|nr:hypothetical protein [Microterricola pindariensis]PPL18332.1 hypothetical protein GY24_10450 [Microterricola pindariensis]
MTESFSLVDRYALGDLQTYLARAGRVEDGSVRLIASGGVLAAYTAIFYPRGILDESPTVLGLRTFALADAPTFDAVVPARSLLERLARAEATIGTGEEAGPVPLSLPHQVSTVTWAGISPPKSGWHGQEPADAALLESVAKAGIDEVAAAVPSGVGEQIVQRVRTEVWGRPIEGLEHIPAGAAFAALSLGFLAGGEPVQVFETGPWTRLSTSRGHVLVRRKPWTLRS